MEYKVISNKEEIENLAYSFIWIMSNTRLQRALKRFARKKGFGEEFIGFLFSNEIDESFQAYDVLKENEVLFSIDEPAAPEDCEAYLTFDEFYYYLETAINRVIEEGHEHEPYDEPEIRRLLKEVKASLGLTE